VHLQRLRLQGFRNLDDVRLEFPPEGIALVGPNAQGKTNLLEAIYYLEILRSFRGARDSELPRFGTGFFRVEGVVAPAAGAPPFEGGRTEQTVAAGWQREGPTKRVTLDGAEPPRLADVVGRVGAVLFTPADLALVNDGPQERRRFLDILLSLNEPGYMDALQRYRQVLSQRNAALREGGAPGAVAAWNDLLVQHGARVIATRRRWVEAVAEPFSSTHSEISGGHEAELAYLPSLKGEGIPEEGTEAEAFREALLASGSHERRMSTTVVGPHRDELRMRVPTGGRLRDVRTWGSGGQRRSVALALRLMEAHTLRERRGREPILLMDDVFAELDESRSKRVLDLLERTARGQVVLTAPRDSDVRLRGDRLPRWGIRDGVITPGSRGAP
jgi:DNA replication and repair protein RecF